MLNSMKEATIKTKQIITDILDSADQPIACTYMKGKHEMKGLLLGYPKIGGGTWDSNTLRPDIKVRSNTGKEYYVLISNITSIKGVDEI